jgi:hypothetical protein
MVSGGDFESSTVFFVVQDALLELFIGGAALLADRGRGPKPLVLGSGYRSKLVIERGVLESPRTHSECEY